MPTVDQTVPDICDGTWKPMAGPGRADFQGKATLLESEDIQYFYGAPAPAEDDEGFTLPRKSGLAFQAVSINVPASNTLYIKGPQGATVTIWIETAAS